MATAAVKTQVLPDFVLELSTNEANYVLDALRHCDPSEDSPLEGDSVYDTLSDALRGAGVLDLSVDHAVVI